MKSEIRWCADIGLYVLDKDRESCVYKTPFCVLNCYNNKLYKIFRRMTAKDERNKAYWASLTPNEFARALSRKKNSISRFRFCARGEPFEDGSAVIKITDIVSSFPNITFQLPTRAWRNSIMKEVIEHYIFPFPNAHVIASIDPSNTKEELNIAHEWRTFFFGDNINHPYGNDNPLMIQCPKTWGKIKGYCKICEIGCFNKEKRHIWLKQH